MFDEMDILGGSALAADTGKVLASLPQTSMGCKDGGLIEMARFIPSMPWQAREQH
jgi:hypothetical protein